MRVCKHVGTPPSCKEKKGLKGGLPGSAGPREV